MFCISKINIFKGLYVLLYFFGDRNRSGNYCDSYGFGVIYFRLKNCGKS